MKVGGQGGREETREGGGGLWKRRSLNRERMREGRVERGKGEGVATKGGG